MIKYFIDGVPHYIADDKQVTPTEERATRKIFLSDYGKTVKIKLLEMGKKQEWLISEIRNRFPDIYVDGSNIYKILTGKINSGKVVSAINEILHI